jgi:hypothetical protein
MGIMRLLDGSTIDVQETLAKMADDRFYYVDMGTDKVLSYSSAKHLLKSPKWFEYKRRNPDPESQALRDGRLVHAAILEPEKYSNFNFVDVSSKNTKKWKLAVEETGKANTFTLKEKYMNARIVDAFLQNNECTSFLKGAEVEVAGLWETGGVPFRGKADILGDDYVADVKTTNDGVAEIELKNGTSKNQFEFTMDKYDYDMQSYLYTQMFNKPRFVWLVVDKTTTDIGVFEASEETIERGRAKVEAAVMLYKAFFVDDLIDLSQYHVKKTI